MATMEKIFFGYKSRLSTLEKTFNSNPFAQGIAWVEGKLTPIHEARIPLLDQGFLHSDLTYDVPSVWDGRFFRLDDHLSRLEKSCARMRLKLPLPKEEVKHILCEMVAKSGIKDAFVELIVTRGLKGVRGAKAAELTNTLYLWIMPYIWCDYRKNGAAHASGEYGPHGEESPMGDLTRGMFEASDRGAGYPFLTDGDGNLTEGSGFNIVLVKDGTLYTPARGVLEGVTRKSVFDCAKKLGIEVKLEFVPVELAYNCDEMFMCTTAGGVMPITSLDGKLVQNGKIGPITQKIWDIYWDMHYDPAYSFEIDYDVKGNENGVNGLLKTNGMNGTAH